jgi:uncharacterized SAM-binding protein YcdF (DUF218 family)
MRGRSFMRSLIAELLLSVPFYALCALGVTTFRAFRARPTSRLRRWRYALVAGFILAYFVSSPAVGNAVINYVEHQYDPRPIASADRNPDNLILVLTGGWARWDGTQFDLKISEDGWERLDAAVKLWQQIGGTILIAGAPSPDGSGRSIAGAMADAVRARGVPDSAIKVEGQSRDTHENLTYSLPLLQAHADHLWLVTSALHLPRAMAVATKLGLRPIPYPCFYRASAASEFEDWVPANDGPVAFETGMHEVIGMVFYRLRGWS